MKSFNILVVEDDEIDRINILRAFKKCNISNNIVFCNDGVEALEYINSCDCNEPLLILLDINMPRMNGLEFLEKLRKDQKRHASPVVILTTSKDNSDLQTAYKFNVFGYLIKPIEFADFVDVMIILGNYWNLCQFPGKKTDE